MLYPCCIEAVSYTHLDVYKRQATDLERLNSFEQQRSADFAVLDRLRTSFSDVPAAEIERQVARAIAQVRAEGESSPHRP